MEWLLIDFQYRVLISFIGCVYIFTRRHFLSFKQCLERMYDLNVTMQHWGRLWIISSNTYSLDSGGLLEIRCECDCQHHHKGGYWNCGLGLSGIWKVNSLRNTLTDSQSNMSLSLCLLFTLMNQHLDVYTYKVEIQQRKQWLAFVDIVIHNR